MSDFKCVVAIVDRGKADLVVDEAKEAGAEGATIFFGRGTGKTEAQRFFNITVESSKEVIIILSRVEKVEAIIHAMGRAGEMKKAGNGIIFSFDVEKMLGFHHRQFPMI